jgi:NAD(P)-dependent dehydrogenase (short-subunit alcohol dehydrogenase family)
LISGSSAGLGAAIARELFKRRASAVLNYPYPSEKANADKVLQSLSSFNRAIAIKANLLTLEGLQVLANIAIKAFSKINILVNSARFI